jgi:hypothetical protein
VGAGTPTAGTTYDYGYGRTAQTAYDSTKTYYQQPAAAAATYSTTDTHYQGNGNAVHKSFSFFKRSFKMCCVIRVFLHVSIQTSL